MIETRKKELDAIKEKEIEEEQKRYFQDLQNKRKEVKLFSFLILFKNYFD